MSCCNLLTGGITLGCDSNTGGVSKLYLTDLCNVTSITEATGTVSAITLASGASFYEFQFNRNSAQLEEPATISLENGTIFYNAKITMTIPRREVSKRNVIKLLASKKLVAIVLDNNGLYHYVGRVNGLELTEQGGGTGAAKGDVNGYILTLTAEEAQMSYFVDSSIIDGIVE